MFALRASTTKIAAASRSSVQIVPARQYCAARPDKEAGKQAEQAMKEGKKEEMLSRDFEENKAKACNPNNPISERIGAGVSAASDKVQEKWHEEKKKYHTENMRDEQAKMEPFGTQREEDHSAQYEQLRQRLNEGPLRDETSQKGSEATKKPTDPDNPMNAGFYATGGPSTTEDIGGEKLFNKGAGAGAHEALSKDVEGQFRTKSAAGQVKEMNVGERLSDPSNPISDRMGGTGPSAPGTSSSWNRDTETNHSGTATKERKLEKEHAHKAQEQRNKASDSDTPITERIGAAASSIGETAKEKLHSVKKQYHEYQADKNTEKE